MGVLFVASISQPFFLSITFAGARGTDWWRCARSLWGFAMRTCVLCCYSPEPPPSFARHTRYCLSARHTNRASPRRLPRYHLPRDSDSPTMTSGDPAVMRRAVELALDGKWDDAHRTVQDFNSNTACWIHAVLHKIEGDAWNSRYWYARVPGREYGDFQDPIQELRAIQGSLAGQ